MRRVAIFGNAGAGKSTTARRLAELTGLPLHVIDLLKFRPGGAPIPQETYLRRHAELIAEDRWIIDGFGCVPSAWDRFARADTLVHIDLPLASHAWWVTKRLLKGAFVPPEGWPAGSPLWSSSLSSYRVLWACHRRLTPRYRRLLAEAAGTKRTYSLRSRADIAAFLAAQQPGP